jgi:P-type Ca2+ transporter type 2B
VPGAIQNCKLASIKVRMVTGDNKDTARAIARDCGIIVDDTDVVIEGDKFIDETGGIVC